jgi:hypothetical protein
VVATCIQKSIRGVHDNLLVSYLHLLVHNYSFILEKSVPRNGNKAERPLNNRIAEVYNLACDIRVSRTVHIPCNHWRNILILNLLRAYDSEREFPTF